MKTTIVPIGNSKGIRIPKAILQQCHLINEVDLTVRGDTIILKSMPAKPREGWDKAFKEMHECGDDRPLLEEAMDLNIKGWQW